MTRRASTTCSREGELEEGEERCTNNQNTSNKYDNNITNSNNNKNNRVFKKMSGGHGSNNIELRHQSLNVLSWGIQRSNKLLDSDYLSNGYCTLKSILPVQFKATQSFSMHSYIGERLVVHSFYESF